MKHDPIDPRSRRTGGTPLANRAIRDNAHTPSPPATLKDGDLSTPMALEEFLTQLGVVMQLPNRGVAARPEISEQPRPPARTKLLLPLMAAVAVLGFAAMQLRPMPIAAVPPEVTGTWETTDARYAGRQLVLSTHGLIIVVGSTPNGEAEVVRRVTSRRLSDTLAVVLTYGSSLPASELALAYVGQPRERLILRNPLGVVWTRVGRADTTVATH